MYSQQEREPSQVTLSNGTVVKRHRRPDGAIEATISVDGRDEMTTEEWQEYAEYVRLAAKRNAW